MRLAGVAKAGFYPASSVALRELLKHLYCRGPDPTKKFDTINILDPCAGKGLAIQQIAEGLNVPEGHIYTVELDRERSEACKTLMPEHHHLGPASFRGVQITGFSFSLAYVNPPFDQELGGGRREEEAFVREATYKLVPKGILVLVCPIGALVGNRSFVEYIDSQYEDVAVYKFPDGEDEDGNSIRSYREIVVIGKKRTTQIPQDVLSKVGKLHQMQCQWRGYIDENNLPELGQVQPVSWNGRGEPSWNREEHLRTWELPHSWAPHVFKKVQFTDDELMSVVKNSPINSILREVVVPPPNAPPLPLDKGHLGLILASGMLDGVVQAPTGIHVVRGSSHKVMYHNKEQSESSADPETGAVRTKDVYSERMVTVIRVVGPNGEIFTFSNEPKEKDQDEDAQDTGE